MYEVKAMCAVLAVGALLPARVSSEDLLWTLVRTCSEAHRLTSTPSEWYSKAISTTDPPSLQDLLGPAISEVRGRI